MKISLILLNVFLQRSEHLIDDDCAGLFIQFCVGLRSCAKERGCAGAEIVLNGEFAESQFRSAPYFDLNIDGITLPEGI